ncbi:MAG: GGDEF domain-containing protein [Clostridiales bacterium]|nr:GGDEF domain-containing protein [Clostridiales bacterium]
MVPILIGSIVQFLYYGLSLIWPSIAIGLTSLFINVQKENSSVDSLSGLYSRQYLDFYINEKTKRLPNDLMLAGIMLDIDSFKSINDSFGHQVGDDAIRSFGHLLTSSVGNDTFVSRYAGDEFIIITELSNKDDIHKIIDRIHEGTRAFNNDNKKQYTISFSTGYSFLENKEDSVEDFLKRMDRAMYKNKKEKLLHHNK